MRHAPLFISLCFLVSSCKTRSSADQAATLAAAGSGAKPAAPLDPEPTKPWNSPLAADELQVVILGTNDIHGGLEPSIDDSNKLVGGMPIWGGIATAIRSGLSDRNKGKVVTVTVDAGDQYQGTLISNTNEGTAMIAAMNAVHYDAIVPGNHDYDFGPVEADYKVDRSPTKSRRLEVVQRAARQSQAPFISANTFLRETIKYADGTTAQADSIRCKPVGSTDTAVPPIDFAASKRPDYVKPYVLKDQGGLKVAIIGLDNPTTPTSTTGENVVDLCFADELATYLDIYDEVKEKGADIVVLVLHDGNAGADNAVAQLIGQIKDEEQKRRQKDPAVRLIDAVVSGHTHYTYAEKERDVPVVQSGSGGKAFGRIDLVWNRTSKTVATERTKLVGGVLMYPDHCDPRFQGGFCSEAGGKAVYEGVPASLDANVLAVVQQARQDIPKFEPLAAKPLGTADGIIKVDGFSDSPMSQAMTDGLRNAATAALAKANSDKSPKIDVAFINASGLRAPIHPQGDGKTFGYEELFQVIPFSNYAVSMDMDKATLLSLVTTSVRNCGYGFLGQSGLKVEFSRNCNDLPAAAHSKDMQAKLLRVEIVGGDVILDAEHPERESAARTYHVSTLDFLADGGSGLVDFKKGQNRVSLGIARDMLAGYFADKNAHLKDVVDDRWHQQTAD